LFTPPELAAAIEKMLGLTFLVVEKEQEIFTAMVAVKEGNGSFADALIAALGSKAGCRYSVTFDQNALRLPTLRIAVLFDDGRGRSKTRPHIRAAMTTSCGPSRLTKT